MNETICDNDDFYTLLPITIDLDARAGCRSVSPARSTYHTSSQR